MGPIFESIWIALHSIWANKLRSFLTVLGNTVPQPAEQISFYQTYPDISRFGVAYRTPSDKLEIRSDFEYVRWSVFKNQCVSKRGEPCEVNADGSAVGDPTKIIVCPATCSAFQAGGSVEIRVGCETVVAIPR